MDSGVLAKVVRRVPLDEVGRRIGELEAAYGGGLDRLSERPQGERPGRDWTSDYAEWSRMIHALRAYREGEGFDDYAEEALELGPKEMAKLTPRRMELMDRLSRLSAESISDLSAKTGRDVKNVYEDLKVLEGLGFVRLVRRGRRTRPELLIQELTLILG